MDAFLPEPPEWTEKATHGFQFHCPSCKAKSIEASKVWLNRRSPVTDPNLKRKWQEFYLCRCGVAWWAWSNERQIVKKHEQSQNKKK